MIHFGCKLGQQHILTLLLSLFCWIGIQTIGAFTIITPTSTTTTTKWTSSNNEWHSPTTIINTNSYHRLHEKKWQHHQQQQSTTTQLYMGWGPEPIWSSSTITSLYDACPSSKSIFVEISVPIDTYTSYTTPGQYVQVKPSSSSISDATDDDTIKPAFLAICSAPPKVVSSNDDDSTTSSTSSTSSTFRFLIKRTPNNRWLTDDISVGSTIDVSQVLGKGYQIEDNINGLKYDFPTQNILLFAAGSGIAPIAAIIESQQLQIQETKRSCRLYYGERTANDLCYVDQFSTWEQMGIEVVPILSQPDDDTWNGRYGYIQNALEEDGISIPRNTAALLCGMKGMTESVKELLLSAGVFDGRILFNF